MPAAATARCAVIAGDRERLVAGALVAAVAALRQAGRPVTRGAITRDGRTRSLADAHDLTPDGVLRRWPQADEGPGEVRIVDAAGVDALTAPPLVGEVAVVALGAVRSELMVDPGAARPTFVLGRALTVTAVTGPGLGESVSTALVAAIRRQLEST